MADSTENKPPVHSVALRDGRALSYAVYGSDAPRAPTIFYFYSYPDSLVGGRIFATAARARGIRIVVPDRPGIGASTFQAGRTIAGWADDVLQLADAPAVAARTFARAGHRGRGAVR
jgi:pimeloyl-ACP methyl ester carboxylesterase